MNTRVAACSGVVRASIAARAGTANQGLGPSLYKIHASAAAGLFALALVGCAGRPTGNLVVVSAPPPAGASTVDMLVATTRAEATQPGVMFSGERAPGLAFAEIAVSIPPASAR